jgi:hypothetical protein
MYINKDIDYLKFLKNRKIIIFGAGKAGIKGLDKIRHSIKGVEIMAVCDNDKNKQGQKVFDVPIISFDKLLEINNNNDCMIIICSGYEREIKQQLVDNKVYNFISISQIDFGGGEEYYDEAYFKWQKSLGQFGGKIKSKMFQPYIKEDMTVVEFGSGGGYLLDNILAKEKIGIEINDTARKSAEEIGIKSVKNISDIKDCYADIIISTSALEHVENPLGVLRELRGKLKENGMIVFHVPNESCNTEYARSDINNHLYTHGIA